MYVRKSETEAYCTELCGFARRTPEPRLGRTKIALMRRLFLAAFFCSVAIGIGAQPSTPPYDVLIRNGRVLDGTGSAAQTVDIAVRDGRIAAMGPLASANAQHVIDAHGLVVSPGFIDVHSHADQGLSGTLKEGRPLLAQGITTVVLNPDGGGPVDLRAERAGFESRGVGVNVALYVGHGSIRREVIGMADRAPTAAELEKMIDLAR